jgi:hypothetical protein
LARVVEVPETIGLTGNLRTINLYFPEKEGYSRKYPCWEWLEVYFFGRGSSTRRRTP